MTNDDGLTPGAGAGLRYWRSLDELADSEEFREWLHREFPREAAVWDDRAIDRRRFLQVMAASFALAGLGGGCSNQGEEKILPYVRAPEGVVPGKPLNYATAMPMGSSTLGLVVTSREGRPIKIEGNALHPASLGATDAWAQASILTLYDPDRSQTVMHLAEISTWEAFLAELRGALEPRAGSGGAGVYLLSETVTSPTLARQMRAFLEKYPQASWHQYEPVCRDNERQGAQLALAQDAAPVYDFSRARVVLSLDSDFLSRGPGSVRYARQFMERRKVRGERKEMSRFYVVESTCTATGSAADHRLPMSPSEIGRLALSLARRLGVPDMPELESPSENGDGAQRDELRKRWLEAVAEDLEQNRKASIVLAGDHQPGWVHAVVHAINAHLGNHGETVRFIAPVEAEPSGQFESLGKLVEAMKAGQVELLLVLGGNPAYNTPRELGFGDALLQLTKDEKTTVHLSQYDDETSALCRWHIPQTHYLESWSDARCFDGTAAIVQPLIDPLYGGKSIHELVSAITDAAVQAPHDMVRATWEKQLGDGFEGKWRKALHDGVIEDSAAEAVTVGMKLDSGALQSAIEANEGGDGGELEIVVLADPTIGDGQFANNGWLQELPKPITKLTWDNAILLASSTADRLGVKNEDLVKLTWNQRAVEGPVWVVPGHPAGSVTVHLGYGRTRGGRVLAEAGFDAYVLLPANGQRIGRGLTVERSSGSRPLACTEHHHLLEEPDVLAGRNIIHSGTLEAFRRDEHAVHGPGHHGGDNHGEAEAATLYPTYEYKGLQWGMAVDMTACTGCNACVVACQAENNIPIVGKQGVINGREMHWLRLDLYYQGEPDAPQAVHQPMLCQHCETAPCEVVCPVMATTHSAEGLNEMTYNRCVGTRYCSNNCPYKVRRFNYFEYNHVADPVKKLMFNPEVTVRSRGVMEKCTYCVQRINAARVAAKIEQLNGGGELRIEDGSLETACQQACPTEAIVFGDINDPESQVAKLKADPLNYGVLSEIGTRPRTTYLARLRNPHPDLS